MRICLTVSLFFYTALSFCQSESVEIEGAIILSDSQDPSPALGTVRWNGQDFEGWDGEWKSFTKSSSSSVFESSSISDIDGNSYRTITIGSQTWMRENLRTSRYNDGTAIPELTLEAQWTNSTPGWCWYQNDPFKNPDYGKLYNWYALSPTTNGNKNVCPEGWHVPTDLELTDLLDTLDPADVNPNHTNVQSTVAGGKMKHVGNEYWIDQHILDSNESGFTQLPSGFRSNVGPFFNIGTAAYLWSVDEDSEFQAWSRWISTTQPSVSRSATNKRHGLAVRCLKD